MILAGYKVWPFVCIMNLAIVPFEYRMLVGNIVGLGWGVYMSLLQL
jgi:protein Mpv17